MPADLIHLPAAVPGTRRSLAVHRFGRPGARPKAYLQAALHADELPGALVLHELVALLAAVPVTGEIVVVPLANPIGLAQTLMGYPLGRYDLGEMANFNRGWPDLVPDLLADVGGRLGAEPAADAASVRAALRARVAALPATGENEALRRELLRLAVDADLVLDLHCDSEAVPHLYTSDACWPDLADLAADLGAAAVLLAEQSGGDPFDELFTRPWAALRREGADVPQGCLSATLELRGQGDVGGVLARADAEGLLRFLARRGVVAGEHRPVPVTAVEATPLAGMAVVRAPVAGIVDHLAPLGGTVTAGEPLCRLVEPMTGEAVAVSAPATGVLFARAGNRLARPGTVLAKIAGREPLAREGTALLPD